MMHSIDMRCTYCGMEYPYPKLTRIDGDFYLVFQDMEESESKKYITLCPNCLSGMVSTYKIVGSVR